MTDQPPSWEELWKMVEDLKQRQRKIDQLAREYRRKELQREVPSKYEKMSEREMLDVLKSPDFGKGTWERPIYSRGVDDIELRYIRRKVRHLEEKADYIISMIKPGGWLSGAFAQLHERLDKLERDRLSGQ